MVRKLIRGGLIIDLDQPFFRVLSTLRSCVSQGWFSGGYFTKRIVIMIISVLLFFLFSYGASKGLSSKDVFSEDVSPDGTNLALCKFVCFF